MANWKQVLTHFVADAESGMDALRYKMKYALGGLGPVKIVPYRGYGSSKRLYLRGRVLEDQGVPEAESNDSFWENLLYMYLRIESDEVPRAKLAARFQGEEQIISADEEGFFEVWIEPKEPLAPDRLWHSIELELLDPIPEAQQRTPVKTTGEVLVPPPGVKYVVVSDIDDTVLQADVANMFKMARNVFLGNAHTRLPFPGVAALYRALFHGKTGNEMNPLFYVSASPWNLYDLLSQFFHLQDIPIGPVLFLRNWGISREELLPVHNRNYKLNTIRQMIEFYPDKPFILIGDSSQEDPEIYAELTALYPKRIQAVYIRNVTRNPKRPESIKELAKRVVEAGSTLVLADDSLAIAKHAVEQGFIPWEALPSIGEEKKKDEAPPSPVEKLLGEEKPAPTPTVRVSERGVQDGQIEEALKEAGKEQTKKPPTVVAEGGEAKARNKERKEEDAPPPDDAPK